MAELKVKIGGDTTGFQSSIEKTVGMANQGATQIVAAHKRAFALMTAEEARAARRSQDIEAATRANRARHLRREREEARQARYEASRPPIVAPPVIQGQQPGLFQRGLTGARSAINSRFALGAAGFIAANETRKLVEFGGQIDDLAKKSDVSREALQEWGYAAKQNGGDINTVATAFKGLSKARLEAMANPTGDTAKMFGMMGIGADEIKGGDPNALMHKIGKGFQGGSFGGLEEGMASKLLGRGGPDMLATFNENFEATIKEAHKLGIILKNDVVANLDRIGDAADRISAVFQGPMASAIVFVSRTIEALINQMGAMFRSLGHLSTISPKDMMSKQGRSNAFAALKESVKAMQDTSPMKLFNDIFNPAEKANRPDDPLPKQEQDVSVLMKKTVEKAAKVEVNSPLSINPDSAARMGMFIGGARPGGGSVNDILGRQQLQTQQQIARNTLQTLSVLNRMASKGGANWGEP